MIIVGFKLVVSSFRDTIKRAYNLKNGAYIDAELLSELNW